jgi:hypothetical protein
MGRASGSSAGAGGSSIDVAESSSLGIPDEELLGSDISIGRDDSKLVSVYSPPIECHKGR